ncbi:hypothetical protein EII14_02735 [Alloprevotella sp. OH1205_COT-284]|nr:hypothetical protein EII14_02735 [Alloprevotella sp. OH1205_COT-284]
MAIQNDVPQSTPLISKSLPIYPLLNGNTLLLSKIVRRQKVLVEDFFSSDLKFPTPRCGIFHRATRLSAPRSGQCPTANDAFWGGAGSLREFIPLFSSKFVSLPQ